MAVDDAKLRLLEAGPKGLKKPRRSSVATKKVSEPELSQKTLPSFSFPSTNEVDELEGKTIAFRPNPGPQTTFLESSEREVLYGGAGGGRFKS